MKVFDGFRLSATGELSAIEVAIAKKLALDTRLEAEARGLFQFRKYLELPGGGYAYSIKAGDFVGVHVVPSRPGKDQYIFLRIPDFGSGWVVDGTRTPGATPEDPDTVTFVPTAATVERLVDVAVAGEQELARYAVNANVETRDDLFAGDTQYEALRASQFSGKMRKLVQLLMGFGRPPEGPNKFLTVAQQVLKASGVKAPEPDVAATKAFTTGVQIDYDSRFYRTHGLAQGADNSWWLIEVSARGLLAMPLQYYRYTTSPSFIAVASTIDAEVALALSTFGGLPTGEAISLDTELFGAMKRAGIVKELQPASAMEAFYDLSPMSSACGWVFNDSGTEAHNIGFGTNASSKLATEHWKVTFSIGMPIDPQQPTDSPIFASLLPKIEAATPPPGVTIDEEAQYKRIIRSKLRYMTSGDLGTAAAMEAQAAFDYIDSVQVERVTASGTVDAMSKNAFYYLVDVDNAALGAEFKMHEPLVGGLISFDGDTFSGGVSTAPHATNPAVTDCPIFVYFVGDTLKYVNFYWQQGTFYGIATPYIPETNMPNGETCGYNPLTRVLIGTGWRRGGDGYGQARSRIYTSDVDERVVTFTGSPGRWYEETVTATYLGEYTYMSPTELFGMKSYANRTHYKSRATWYEEKWNREVTTHAVVPQGTRSGCFICVIDAFDQHYREEFFYDVEAFGNSWSSALWRIPADTPEGDKALATANGAPACAMDQDEWRHDTPEDNGGDTSCQIPTSGVWNTLWFAECDVFQPGGTQLTGSGNSPLIEDYQNLTPTATYKLYASFEFVNGGVTQEIHSGTTTDMNTINIWQRFAFNAFDGRQQCSTTHNSFGSGTTVVSQTGPNGWGPGLQIGSPMDTYIQQQRVAFVGVVNGD